MKDTLTRTRELQIDGHLEIEGPQGRLTLAGSGQRVVLAADSLGPFLGLLKAGPGSRWSLSALRMIHSRLAISGIALELHKGGQLVGRLGRQGRPILAALRLGIDMFRATIATRHSSRGE